MVGMNAVISVGIPTQRVSTETWVCTLVCSAIGLTYIMRWTQSPMHVASRIRTRWRTCDSCECCAIVLARSVH